ncbi:DsbA family oxidoreductase [Kaistella sp. PBT33-4]|uniref:DsbA family oxidoreductase n=1 Tax=Kaistella sp. PBT33-4 TaxID=3032000 RepID=UPI0023D7BCBE|nr:DsbA family oxidoreductase [Kaistella sp. PBT33-4]MDF0720074.1 DsbA family oxidoreductase [Kaistella sp. PBT33-4]
MKINIWSDVRCPFCYVGKKKFEKAMSQFPEAAGVTVEWHSFQLDPSLETQAERDPFEFFAERKGISRQQAQAMHSHAENAGREAGIDFNFENQKVANSYKAHLLIQLAKTKNLGSEIEEVLFRAQFLDGKNIDDVTTLVDLGIQAGLLENDIRAALESDEFAYAVSQDMQMASKLGFSSVPFFVFNDKYGVSGAQQPELFLEILEKSWKEFSEGDHGLKIINGDSCDTDGNCN